MSIPLDRLYHYIESVARDIHSDTIIYRFYPHGSKNLNDLTTLRVPEKEKLFTSIELICHDQEPLCYNYYKNIARINFKIPKFKNIEDSVRQLNYTNLRFSANNIYDKCLLLHSEENSAQVIQYSTDYFIPVYYWSHALISLDWYRYARYLDTYPKNTVKKFLIYNRAWTGTREYRLKFADLLIDHHLVDQCQTSCSFNGPNEHYSQHEFINQQWRPVNQLEDYFLENTYSSTSSADFTEFDYQLTDIEIVLETLFDDKRHHLTEKTLRPIALGQPFILVSTPGSLDYLRNYGFKTFGSIIDESYDHIQDPVIRLNKIIQLMSDISNLPKNEYQDLIKEMSQISIYNKQHFFSNNFFNQVVNELKDNLENGILELLTTNTYNRFVTLRQQLNSSTEYLTWSQDMFSSQDNEFRNSLYEIALKLKNNN